MLCACETVAQNGSYVIKGVALLEFGNNLQKNLNITNIRLEEMYNEFGGMIELLRLIECEIGVLPSMSRETTI